MPFLLRVCRVEANFIKDLARELGYFHGTSGSATPCRQGNNSNSWCDGSGTPSKPGYSTIRPR